MHSFFDVRSSALVVIFGLCATCGRGADSRQRLQMSPPPSQSDNYLGSGDLFEIRVYGEKELSGEYRVSSDGTIDFPLIGTVSVAQMTPSEVRDTLQSALIEGQFLREPQISILVKEYTSKRISVFGQVNKPGTFQYFEGMGVVEAISSAGGFTPMAKPDDTKVTRVVDGEQTHFVVPVEQIGRGRSGNFFLHPGDIVFIPERLF